MFEDLDDFFHIFRCITWEEILRDIEWEIIVESIHSWIY